MKRTHVAVAAGLLVLFCSTAIAAPKKKKKKAKKAPEPAAEPAAAPEPTPTPEPEPAAAAPEPAPAAAPEGGAGGGGGASLETSGAAVGGDVSASASAPGGWPQEIIARPPTLRKSMLRAGVTLPVEKTVTTSGTPPVVSSATGVRLGLEAGYGLSDKLELGARYAISLKEFEAKGPLSVFGAYSIMEKEKMKGAAIGSFTYNLLGKTGGIGLGMFFQYNLSPKMALYTPGDQLTAQFIAEDPDAAGPLEAPKPIALHLPVGFAFQVNKNIYAFGQTNIADIKISQSANAFLFADAIPLTAGLFYSLSNSMEFGAQIASADLPDIADNFAFAVVGRMFVGDAVKGMPAPPAATTAGL